MKKPAISSLANVRIRYFDDDLGKEYLVDGFVDDISEEIIDVYIKTTKNYQLVEDPIDNILDPDAILSRLRIEFNRIQEFLDAKAQIDYTEDSDL